MRQKPKGPQDKNKLSELDEVRLDQLKPYAIASIVCLALAIYSLVTIGFQPALVVFWLSVVIIVLNVIFLGYLFIKARRIRQ